MVSAFTDLLKKEKKEKKEKKTSFANLLKHPLPEQAAKDQAAAEVLNQADVDRSGLADTSLRFQLARADNFEEKQRVFNKKYPRGELKRVPGSIAAGTRDELVYKFDVEDPNERFKSLERGDEESFSAAELGRDFTEFVGEDAGALAGELFMALQSRGLSLTKSAFREGLGALFGEYADQGVQELEGVNTQSFGDVSLRSGQQGAISTGGGIGFGSLQRGLINIGRGSGLLKQKPGAVEAEQARQRLNQRLPEDKQIEPFTPGQVSETPVFQRLDEQSIALAGGLRQQRRNQIAGVGRATREAESPRELAASRKRAQVALERENAKLGARLNGRGDFETAGLALNKALNDPVVGYRATSGRHVDELYRQAAIHGDPVFDLNAPLAVAGELKRGTRAAGKPFTPNDGLSDLDRLSRTGSVDARNSINVEGPLSPELKRVISDLESIDPDFPAGEGIDPPWKVLKELRSRLFDLKTPKPGEVATVQNRQAAMLYREITKTMDAPIGGSPAFKDAWDAARHAASQRYEKLELSSIVELAKTDKFTGFAQRLAQPGSADMLKQLQRVLDEPTMRQVTNAFKLDLASDLSTFTNRWKALDRETLRRLLKPEEIKLFEKISVDLARLSSTGIEQALETQSRNRLFVRELIDRKDSAGVSALRQLVNQNGGRNGPLGRSISAGIVDDIFEDVIAIQAAGGTISSKQLRARMRELDNLGLGYLLRAQDRMIARDIIDIAPFVTITSGGAGASIQAADVAENLVSFGDPKAQLGGLASILQKIGYARTMRTAAARRILIGAGKERLTPNATLSGIGAALALGLTDIDESTPEITPQ